MHTIVQVEPGSSADLSGLHAEDIIVQCGGRTVQSFLEVWVCFLEYIFFNDFKVNVFMNRMWV